MANSGGDPAAPPPQPRAEAKSQASKNAPRVYVVGVFDNPEVSCAPRFVPLAFPYSLPRSCGSWRCRPARQGQGTFARVGIRGGGTNDELWLMSDRPTRLGDGSFLRVAGVGTRPGLLLQRRHAPGNPWALLASVLLALGLAMMWRRFLPVQSAHSASG